MIQAHGATEDGRPLAILGLTDNDWRRLRNGTGDALRLDLSQLGLPAAELVIIAARTEDGLSATISRWFPERPDHGCGAFDGRQD